MAKTKIASVQHSWVHTKWGIAVIMTLGAFVTLLIVLYIIGSSNIGSSNGEKIIFTLPAELPEATAGTLYTPYSFCEPDSSRSGATCGALAGETTNPVGGSPPYSFSVQSGKGFIPTGMVLELNGLLTGTPILPGTYTFGICAKDSQDEACKTTSILVKPKGVEDNVAPSITIDSATATLKETSGSGNSCQATCTFELSGTATGSLYTQLKICWGLNGETSWCDIEPTCSGWTEWGNVYCGRMLEDSGSTKWSMKMDRVRVCGDAQEVVAELTVYKFPRPASTYSWNEFYAGDFESDRFTAIKTLTCG